MNGDKENFDLTPLPTNSPLDSTSDPLTGRFPINVDPSPITVLPLQHPEVYHGEPKPIQNPVTFATPYVHIPLSQYNGSHGFSDYESSQIALALALSQSASEVKSDPHDVFLSFMESFHNKKFAEALSLYENADLEAKQLIDSELEEIPWRISSEYCFKDNKLQWINSWVKIGWWSKEVCEISPQFSKGKWFSESSKHPAAINTNCFDCVVWEGKGKAMLHRLLAHGNRVNIELAFSDGFLIPVNVAFKGPKDFSNVFDLAVAEVGSLDPLEQHDLDILRIGHKVTTCQDGTKMKLFRGCTIGASFIPESELIVSELIADDLEDTGALEDLHDSMDEDEVEITDGPESEIPN